MRAGVLFATLLAACAHRAPEAAETSQTTAATQAPTVVETPVPTPAPACPRPDTFLPLCEAPETPWAVALERVLAAGGIEHEACLHEVLADRELGFTLTDTVEVSAEGDTARYELYGTLVPADDHALRWGPDVRLAAELEESGGGDETSWRGWTRTHRACGRACIALGPGTNWVGTIRYPAGRLEGVRRRNARDDEEDRMRFHDEGPTPEEQREIDALVEIIRLNDLPRSVDLTTLRGESTFP